MAAAAKLLPEFACLPGFAVDFTVDYEFGKARNCDDAPQRQRAHNCDERSKPSLLVGSPMCTAFSAWQRDSNRKRDPALVKREYGRVMVHIRLCMELYAMRVYGRRYL